MKTIVVFRCWENGDVIALFPEEPGNNGGTTCNSYERIGQHGAAHYNGVIKATRPASPEEYKDLAKELSSYPYNYELDIRKRANWNSHNKRMVAAMESYYSVCAFGDLVGNKVQ